MGGVKVKLYLIYQDKNTGYDTYDSAVVSAESEDEARRIHPGGYFGLNLETWGWTEPKNVQVELIAEVTTKPKGVICASFNAG
jgi:hypothetical protein